LLVYAANPALDGDFARKLGEALLSQTGSRWQVRAGEGAGRPSLGQMRAVKLADNDARIRELPVVKAALAAFPDAQLEAPDDNRHRTNP
jgi:DNA polymerase-3 subunit gamma/tau